MSSYDELNLIEQPTIELVKSLGYGHRTAITKPLAKGMFSDSDELQ